MRKGEGTAFVLLDTQKTRKHVIITLCVIFGAIFAGGAAYLFLPITLYSETDGGYTVTLCRTGLTGNASVERYKDGKPVVGINSGAFKNNFFLKSIELPNTLTYIEGEAFMNCVALESITIPPMVTEILGDTIIYGDEGREKQAHIMTHQVFYNTLAAYPSDKEGYYCFDMSGLLRLYGESMSQDKPNNMFFTTAALRDYHYLKHKSNAYYHIQAQNLPFQNIELFYCFE